MNPVKRDLLPKSIANALSVSSDTIGRYARAGLIPFNKTPKGHRRFNLDEVRQALIEAESVNLSRLSTSSEIPKDRLVLGPAVVVSKSARLRENLRATRTTPATSVRDSERSDRSSISVRALDEVLEHARRVLITN